MKRVFLFLLLVQLVLFGKSSIFSSSQEMKSQIELERMIELKLSASHFLGRFLVKIKKDNQDQIDAFSTLNILSNIGLEVDQIIDDFKFTDSKILENIETVGMDRWFIIDGFNPRKEKEVFKNLLNNQSFEKVEPDYLVFADFQTAAFQAIPNDPLFEKQWSLNNTGQNGGKPGADIKALRAWEIWSGMEDKGVVGIIDSGVDYDHPDLRDNIAVNEKEIPDNGIDDDNNGFVDDVKGWNFYSNNNNVKDDFGHGTLVAGVIAAEINNGVGIAGITKTKIGIVKFLDSTGRGWISAGVKALHYSINRGFEISNNSWGDYWFSDIHFDAISLAEKSGILFVASAGNNWKRNNDERPVYPANYNLPNVISVGATDSNDELAYFSNYGLRTVHLAAPGLDIISTAPEGNCEFCSPNGYASSRGTSFSAPMVSAAASLLFSYYRSKGVKVDYKFVKEKIILGTDVLESITDKFVSGGRLNLYNLLEEDNVPPDPVDDLTVSNTTSSSITLDWTATGDDGKEGSASRYEIRYSTEPIDENNFDQTTKVLGGGPVPKERGEKISYTLAGLNSGTKYYIAIRALDNVGNRSKISKVSVETAVK